MNALLPRQSPQDCPLGPGSHLVRGAIEFVVMCALRRGEMAETEIAAAIERLSGEAFAVVHGPLHQALERLALRGWVRVRTASPDTGGHRFHRLTATGQRQWVREKEAWLRVSQAVTKVVTASAPSAPLPGSARAAGRMARGLRSLRTLFSGGPKKPDPLLRCA